MAKFTTLDGDSTPILLQNMYYCTCTNPIVLTS